MSAMRRAWRRSTTLRVLVVAYLIVVAGGAIAVAFGALSNLWADDQDSTPATYLAIGVPALVVGLAALFAAVRIWRDR